MKLLFLSSEEEQKDDVPILNEIQSFLFGKIINNTRIRSDACPN